MFCNKCGAKAIDGSAFCQNCGAKLIVDEKVIIPHTYDALEPHSKAPLSLNKARARLQQRALYLIFISVLAIPGIVILIAKIADSMSFGGSYTTIATAPYTTTATTVVSDNDDVELSQAYTAAMESYSITTDPVPTTTTAMHTTTAPATTTAPTTTAFSEATDLAAIGDRIEIGETQLYTTDYSGHMEVTLDYVEFLDKIENELHEEYPDIIPEYTFPDEGNVFLRAGFTLNNTGTTPVVALTTGSTVVYDGANVFNYHSEDGRLHNSAMTPSAPSATGSLYFEVVNAVAESDGSLVINFDSGNNAISFTVRPKTGGSAGQAPTTGNSSHGAFNDVLTTYGIKSAAGEYSDVTTAFYDVDVNGTAELVIRYQDVNFMTDNMAIYTSANGSAYEIASFGDIRGAMWFDRDGYIYTQYVSGYGYFSDTIERISDDGTSLVEIESWEADYINSKFTHTTTTSAVEIISESDYDLAASEFNSNRDEDFIDSLDWQPLSGDMYSLTEDSARELAQTWLSERPDMYATLSDDPAETYEAQANEYYLFSLGDQMYWLSILVDKDTGELFALQTSDGEDAGEPIVDPLDDYYARFFGDSQSAESDTPAEPAVTTEAVSADGYILSPGSTVYVKGGGFSLIGSATEGVLKQKTDGSWSVEWVAVLEDMGFGGGGWQRSEIYQDYWTRKYWSPSAKNALGFSNPNVSSLNQLYLDFNNIS